MRQPQPFQRILTLTLGASAIAWLCAVTCPRCHDEAVSSDADPTYHVSWIVQELSATPPPLPTIPTCAVLIQTAVVHTVPAPACVRVARLAGSRAPPAG